MNIKRVIAAAALTVVPLTASSAALAAPAAPQGAPAAAAVPAQVTSEGAQYADTVLNKVNELRSSLNLQPVTRYQELDAVAQDWSEQQAAANNMSHRPDFTSVYPKGWTTGSENVAWRTAGGDTGALIFDQWLNSPGHYKNMTDPNVNSIGIGFAQTSDGRWYATQNFAAYNVSNSTLTPSTTTTTNTTTTTKSNTPPKTNDNPPTDTTVPSPTPTPETTPSTPATETTAPAAPPTSETTAPASTPSAPATTVTTETVTTTGTPAKPSATPAVAAPRTTPTKSALATTGPSIAVAVVAAGLLGAGAVLVMRRRQAS